MSKAWPDEHSQWLLEMYAEVFVGQDPLFSHVYLHEHNITVCDDYKCVVLIDWEAAGRGPSLWGYNAVVGCCAFKTPFEKSVSFLFDKHFGGCLLSRQFASWMTSGGAGRRMSCR